jgi:hypothetical protein
MVHVRDEDVVSGGQAIFRGGVFLIGSGRFDQVHILLGEVGAVHEKIEEIEGRSVVVDVGVDAEHPEFILLLLVDEVDGEYSEDLPEFERICELPDNADQLGVFDGSLGEVAGQRSIGLTYDLFVGRDDLILPIRFQTKSN